MKGDIHPSSFTAISFPDLKRVPIYWLVEYLFTGGFNRELSSCRMVKPGFQPVTLCNCVSG